MQLSNKMIENLEDYQASDDLGYAKYYTDRRRKTFNNIERILTENEIQFHRTDDKRFKVSGYDLAYLGEICRIDYSKASFIKTAYLDLESEDIICFDHCVNYSV